MEYFHDADHFPFYDQRDAIVADDLFLVEKLVIKLTIQFIRKVANLYRTPLDDRFPGITFS